MVAKDKRPISNDKEIKGNKALMKRLKKGHESAKKGRGRFV